MVVWFIEQSRTTVAAFYSSLSDFGDPTVFSQGDLFANQCVDYDANSPYNYHEPLSKRLAAYQRAVKKLPSDFFSPFSISVGTDIDFELTHQYAYWEEPTRHIPLVPEEAVYPDAPVLALASDIDTFVPIEMVQAAANQFPYSSMVVIPEAFHEPVLSNGCANGLATTFIETLQLGRTTCTQVPEVVWPALGRFPIVAASAHLARPRTSQRSNILARHSFSFLATSLRRLFALLARSVPLVRGGFERTGDVSIVDLSFP